MMPENTFSPYQRRKFLQLFGTVWAGIGVSSGETETQQQSEWDRFFNHDYWELIVDTEPNAGGCLLIYDKVKKLDQAGDQLWERTYDPIIPVSKNNDGGYLAVGDGIARLNPDGSHQWTRNYGERGLVYSLAEERTGGFYLGGGYFYPEEEYYSNWIVKINGMGDVEWEITESLTGSHPDATQSVREIFNDEGGGCVAFVWNKHRGATDSSTQSLIGVNKNGTKEWEVELPGDRYVPEARQTEAGNYLVRTGISGPNSKLTVVNDDGVRLWVKEYGDASLPEPIIDVGDGFIFADSPSTRTFRIKKVGLDGNERWTETYDSRNGNSISSIELGSPNGYLLAGSGGENPYEQDAWIMKVNADRKKVWEQILDFSTGIRHLHKVGEGRYLLGGSGEESWVASRESPILRLPDVTGDGNLPRDPDRDGLYEDVNGDGDVNVGDAQALYSNRDSDAVQDYVRQYDFNGDDAVNVGDAQTLFNEGSEDE